MKTESRLTFLARIREFGPIESGAVLRHFRRPDGSPDALRCLLLLGCGRSEGERLLETALGDGIGDQAAQVAREVVDEVLGWEVHLTGAEAVAGLLAAEGVAKVFIYAGTSELALGDAVDRVETVQLINGRGDKESAFMAAGASLLEANRGAAIVHGARGLTNAMGAIADARRSEAGTVMIVGLPSTESARFLPPHGEPGLLDSLSGLVDWQWQAGPIPSDADSRSREASRFADQLRRALAFAARTPHRPALFGVPQDLAEKRWLPLAALICAPRESASVLDDAAVESAVEQLLRAQRPLLLVDDPALRYPGMREALDRISTELGAPVLQVRYRRGPMLFERLGSDVANFVGWLDRFHPAHLELLDSCDLLMTVEDRNIYERVVGTLPACRKIAVNTDSEKVLKNEYLEEKDILVVGDPVRALDEMVEIYRRHGGTRCPAWFAQEARTAAVHPEPAAAEVSRGRAALVSALADTLAGWSHPVLVDDSQMFGGLLAEHYDMLPRGLRVFGGHGAFVGSGLSYATGLAIANDNVRVMCTLGDQAFTNSFQGLVAAVQERARVLYVVCNNGESVSLKKQGLASYGAAERGYLSNVKGLRYHAIARALGIPTDVVAVPLGGNPDDVDAGVRRLSEALAEAADGDGPSLIELVLPSAPEVWAGIWLTQGFEQPLAAAR